MGLPVKLVCAVNSNDVVARVLETGIYSVEGPVIKSLAPAMDIQMAYNLERLFWLFSDGDSELVKELMNQFELTSRVEIPHHIHSKMKGVIRAHTVDDAGILTAMRRCWTENQYLICPHTSTAVHYYYNQLDSVGQPVRSICLATASPAKFREAVLAAGLHPAVTPDLDALKSKPTRYTDMEKGEDWHGILRDCIRKIAERRSGEETRLDGSLQPAKTVEKSAA